jgi:hypothetical protein
VRHKASRLLRNTKSGIPERLINELEINSENKKIIDLYRGINEFKKSYQPITSLVKE